MANLSDLAEQLATKAPPAWIDALSHSAGFVENSAGLAARPAITNTPPECDDEELALAEAYQNGFAEGRKLAEGEARECKQAASGLKQAFTRLDDAASLALSHHIAETIAALCAEMIEPHLIDGEALAERCAQAAKVIGESPTSCTLHLHPDDISLLEPEAVNGSPIVADPTLDRGSLMLEGVEGIVSDGPNEWRRAIAAALAQ